MLAKEKAVTRERDELSRLCRELPREPVEKAYVFDGPHDEESLRAPFASRSQFIVYHLTFDPDVGRGLYLTLLISPTTTSPPPFKSPSAT